jgi:NAD(P)-dependent dehydrogenase (short-subunit alcohol dehydrogenase family)
MLLDGKTVVVSGVGPGLGREVAEAALAEGANVVIGARTESRLKAIAAGLDPSGERVAYSPTNIGDQGDCDGLAGVAQERFGGVDALVNCAAYDSLMGGLEDADLAQWAKVFEINVIGSMRMVRAVLPQLKASGGAVVFIGSQNMYWPPQVMQMAYAASKGALMAASFSLAKELGPYRIRVNTVVPTWMWGPPVEGYVNYMADTHKIPVDDVIGGLTKGMPLGEIPSDEDVAQAVVFLASDRARMITGQALLVNAGEYFRY